MFGYITPCESELKVKEQQFYKSVYCGLCKCMKKRVCPESTLTLSYDVVFLVLLRFLLSEEKIEFKKCRCSVSPFKKKTVVCANPTLEYSAAVGALLAYHNIADDAQDKKGIKKALARILLLMSRKMRRKAALPSLDQIIEGRLKQLKEEEDGGCGTLDSCAEHFALLLSDVFSYGYEGNTARIASEIGYNIGRWIYIADACDDYEKDKINGEFNPIREFDRDKLSLTMTMALTGVEKALDLITVYDDGIMNIIRNIIYLGMPDKAEKILSKDNK